MDIGKRFAICGIALLASHASGFCDRTSEMPAADRRSLQSAAIKCEYPGFKRYLESLTEQHNSARPSGDDEAERDRQEETESALRVADDLKSSPKGNSSCELLYYTVSAMSNIKRTRHKYPDDGTLAGTIRMIAAQGEFEAASLVFYPFVEIDKVKLEVSDLAGKNGTIPASALDIKVVKIWYQAGTAWYSFYADKTGRMLVPELLLNDESLVKVDRKTKDNYLRVDYPEPRGSQYVWISNPAEIDVTFNNFVEPVSDAKTLQPFSLRPGEFKQIWLTLKAPKGIAGIFSGTITATAEGKPLCAIPLKVRVLPFELPEPKTNYDLARTFYASMYNHSYITGDHTKKNGGGQAAVYDGGPELAKQRLFNQYVNMRRHNLLYPQIKFLDLGYEDAFRVNLETYKRAGLHTDVIIGAVSANDWGYSGLPEVRNNPLDKQPVPFDLIHRVDSAYNIVKDVLKPSQVYCIGADEPAMARLVAQRKPWRYIHSKGLKIFNTGNAEHLLYGGYNEDFINYGGHLTRDAAEKWHSLGALITSYAEPHTGPENPDFSRRSHGMKLYHLNADGTCNFVLNWYPWNDFINEDENIRGLNMVYPTYDGVIDTLQWEGFREGIDDIRYATLLKQMAAKVIKTGETDNIYEGRMALQYLAMLDSSTCDLNAARLEMISYILKLRSLLQSENQTAHE